MDNIRNKFDRITAQTPEPRLTLWRLGCDKHLIQLRPNSITKGGRVKAIVVVTITIQTIAIQVLPADSSTRGDNVGSTDVDNMWVAHDAVVEMVERDVTLDK